MRLKPKQKEDLARAALRDGLIFAWDTGLGKTIGSYLWSLLKVGFSVDAGAFVPKEPVLIVGPADGFEQWKTEGQKLRINLVELNNQAKFHQYSRNGKDVPPGFYFSSFTQMARNGVKQFSRANDMPRDDDAGCPLPFNDWSENIGECRGGIKCVYSPTLADLSSDTFACVIVDEGVHIKGAQTLVGKGVRQLNPRYRLVVTATPIKNRLPDVFWLAWWAAGGKLEPHAQWPYAGTVEAQRDFAERFLVVERNLTREWKARLGGRSTKCQKLTASVCNVPTLWKLFAPVVLRRRKQDMAADMPPKVHHVLHVPMGARQAAVYEYHLRADYLDRYGRPAIGAKLQALRIAATNPCSPLLMPVGNEQSPEFRSSYDYTPKLAAALNLISRILDAGEQAILFSAFQCSLDMVGTRLTQAGVPHIILDGRTPPNKRGILAARFKNPAVPVLLAGIESMAEMHSFPECSNAILLSYSWAWDKFEQAINRIHRINSRRAVHVYSLTCRSSIDQKLYEIVREKACVSTLVIDGETPSEDNFESKVAQLLVSAISDFDSPVHTIDERDLQSDWARLREKLRHRVSRNAPSSLHDA